MLKTKTYNFMQASTYILLCNDGSFYTGSTCDLRRRFWQHVGHGPDYTAKRLPVKLVYFETYHRVDIAYKREKQIQGWSRKKKWALINAKMNLLKSFSICQNSTHSGIRLMNVNSNASDIELEF